MEKQKYESHYEQIINCTNMRDLKEFGEQRIPLEELLNR